MKLITLKLIRAIKRSAFKHLALAIIHAERMELALIHDCETLSDRISRAEHAKAYAGLQRWKRC